MTFLRQRHRSYVLPEYARRRRCPLVSVLGAVTGCAKAKTEAQLQAGCRSGRDKTMTNDQQATILAAIERAPDWMRRDLAAKDEASRRRAEESLAAIIASALEPQAAI